MGPGGWRFASQLLGVRRMLSRSAYFSMYRLKWRRAWRMRVMLAVRMGLRGLAIDKTRHICPYIGGGSGSPLDVQEECTGETSLMAVDRVERSAWF